MNSPQLHKQNRVIACLANALLVLAVLAATASGVTPEDYGKSLESAREQIQELLAFTASAEIGEPNLEAETALVSKLRNTVPPVQRIEFGGGTIETANRWLHANLDAFENETDTTKRAVILTETGERLLALLQSVRQLENAAAGNTTKDEDKQKLAEILRREEYQKPVVKSESVFERWLREFIEWFGSLFPTPSIGPAETAGSPRLSYILLVVLGVLAAGLIGFLLYKFGPLISPKWRPRRRARKKDRVILGERIADDDSSSDLFGEAERLAREGNLRGAIRKGYIAALCELSDRRIIGLAGHKTNRDYLRDIRMHEDLLENMRGLTSSFEQHWYGSRTPETSDWDEFQEGYKNVQSSRFGASSSLNGL